MLLDLCIRLNTSATAFPVLVVFVHTCQQTYSYGLPSSTEQSSCCKFAATISSPFYALLKYSHMKKDFHLPKKHKKPASSIFSTFDVSSTIILWKSAFLIDSTLSRRTDKLISHLISFQRSKTRFLFESLVKRSFGSFCSAILKTQSRLQHDTLRVVWSWNLDNSHVHVKVIFGEPDKADTKWFLFDMLYFGIALRLN